MKSDNRMITAKLHDLNFSRMCNVEQTDNDSFEITGDISANIIFDTTIDKIKNVLSEYDKYFLNIEKVIVKYKHNGLFNAIKNNFDLFSSIEQNVKHDFEIDKCDVRDFVSEMREYLKDGYYGSPYLFGKYEDLNISKSNSLEIYIDIYMFNDEFDDKIYKAMIKRNPRKQKDVNSYIKNTNNMKRIKDSKMPDEWFMNGKAPLLNEPDSQNDTLWKVVLWSGSGYAADPYLFYAPKDFSEWQFEVLVAALDKNGITDYYEDDYYWNNPDIDTSEDAEVDVYDLMDENGDIYIDASVEGGGVHVLRGENLKIEPADEPIEYYMGSDEISDSRKIYDREELTYDDDAWREAQKIMNAYDKEVGWSELQKPKNGFPRIVGVTMRIAENMEFRNPERVYEYLEDGNYHKLNTILALMGKLGKKYENEERRVIEQYHDGNAWYEYLYNTLGLDYFKRGSVSDSRRVKDNDENDEYYFVVAVVGSESMSLEEGRKYEKELSEILTGKRYSNRGAYCEITSLVEPMDRVHSGDESVAVWGQCYADSSSTVRKVIKQWTSNLGYDVRVSSSFY